MKKEVRILLPIAIIILISVIVIKGLSGLNNSQQPDIKGVKDKIVEVLKNVYTPESMGEFYSTRSKWVKEFMSSEAADILYQSDNNSLSEKDLSRELKYSIAYSPDTYNSNKRDHYLADIEVKNGKGEKLQASIYFYMDSSKQYVEEIEITNVKLIK